MIPTLVIVGRPNVGKSTLFNRLTKTRDALVADLPGLTRDRHYGHGRLGSQPYLVVDTGGFEPVVKDGIMHEMARQTQQAIAEADVIVFLTDGRQGLTSQDRIIANQLRCSKKPVFVVVNKTEGMAEATATAEFHELGLGDPLAISSAHGEGVSDLIDVVLADFEVEEEAQRSSEPEPAHPRIAIVGRPNVGKSTLLNSLLGEERVIAFDEPGTTRDSIYVEFSRNGKPYTLIDTAGIRRRGKVFEAVEKFSVIKTLQAIEDANVVVLVLDARQDISDQDAHIAGFIVESGRALVVAINKWDNLDPGTRETIKTDISRKLMFLRFAKFHYISALDGSGLGGVINSVDVAYTAAMARLSTPKLTRTLIAATTKHSPPMQGAIRPKLRYAHQGGHNPPLVIIHGTSTAKIPETYRRYLENVFRDTFELEGTPLRVQFNQGHNPYANKRPSQLTEGQENRRRRNRRHQKRTFS
ncbi:MAG: ribosome biogenesis GTPase Der [Pseudomonadota bacterium]